jgi:Transglycosylase-like domain/Putative peptidoglycan binding domain
MSPHNGLAAPVRWRASLMAVVAALTLGAFTGAAATVPAAAEAKPRVLKVGSTGRLVKKVQRKLSVRPRSGYYGRKTKRAVKRFQRREGLSVDGVAGPSTLRALGLRVRSASRSSDSDSSGGTAPEEDSGSSDDGSGPRLPRVLRKIAKCESGGNPRAVSPDGRYRGKFQFDRATWRAWGGEGDPAKAPESEQDRIALKLYRARGTEPWPNCA